MTATPDDPTSADVAVDASMSAAPAEPAWPEPARAPSGPTEHGRGPRRSRAPLPLAASVAAVWAAITVYGPLAVLAVIGVVGSAAGGPAGTGLAAAMVGAVRVAAMGWLLGQGVPLETAGDQVTLVPLAVAALVAWRLTRAGVHASRAVGGHLVRSPSRALIAAGAVALAYGAIGSVTVFFASTPGLSASPARAGLTLGVFGFIAAGLGAVSHGRVGRFRRAMVPRVIRDVVRTGCTAAALILAAGTAATGAALAVHGGDAADVLGSYRAGIVGQAGISALSAVYAPNAAVWGTAYLLGPGFSVGVDTVVSPGLVVLGPMPALPLLAAVPAAPAPGSIASVLLGVPLAVAMYAGWLLGRRRAGRESDLDAGTVPAAWARHLAAAALAGPCAGVVLQGLGWLSSGAVGSGRLSVIGPTGWRVGLLAMFVVTFGAVAGVVAARLMSALRG